MALDPKRVKEIFLEAADLSDETARAAYLDKACGADAGVRERVEALLRSHDPEGSFLGTPAAVVHDPDHGATQALTGTPEPGVAAAQTAGGENGSSDDEPLTFLAPPTRPDALGRLGHYEVLQVLGRGGFGIVFRAFDEMLQRVVALKVMAPQLAATSPARKRFLREARSSAQVRHENVVQVYEVAEQPLPYLAMEFIPGETLQQRLDRVGPLDVPEVLRVGRQIAEGLAAAHATDLIHRDIKPGNVLLEGGQHKVKITDFGLARTADDASISQSGLIAGTPMYMAPEQAQGQPLDQCADLFSLGSVLYQMVAGRPPFRATTAVAVLKRVAEDKPRAIREIIPEAPQWLCDIIAKLHAKDPDDRYQSAREVADVLADCEAQLKAHARLKDYSRIPRSKPQRSGRRKWLAAAAAVLLLPVFVLAVTESAGVTHLFRGQPAATDTNKSGNDPLARAGAGWNGWPADAPPPALAPFDAAKARAHQEAWAKYLGVPVEFEDSIAMKFRLIPPGTFMMGSENEVGRETDEFQHPVANTKPLYMGAYTVTVGQFKTFVKETNYRTEAEKNDGALVFLGNGGWKTDPKANWQTPGYQQTDNHPVVAVSWNDCQAFCEWLSTRDGKRCTLPTEAQWEYACRAGSQAKFYFGGDDRRLQEHAWFVMNTPNGKANKVGLLKPNAWGLFDMHGNVFQWCADWYAADYYQNSPLEDPLGPPGNSGRRVMRGANFSNLLNHCRDAFRRGIYTPSARATGFGFRVAIVGNLKQEPALTAPAFTDADVQRIAALPAEQQVEEVRKELMRRNPGFPGTVERKIENGVVTEFKIVTDQVTDIAPIRVWSALRVLECSGTNENGKPNGLLADLGPLTGMNLAGLTHLSLDNTKVGDAGLIHFKDCKNLRKLHLFNTKLGDAGLANFKDCKNLTDLSLGNNTQVGDAGMVHFQDCKALTSLDLSGTKVSDVGLAHFKDCKNLKQLYLNRMQVGDAGLTQFKGMPLRVLWIHNTGITDLTPLQGMPLEDIRLTPKNITKGLDILRDMKGLQTIGIAWKYTWPAAEFWERYDKGEFK